MLVPEQLDNQSFDEIIQQAQKQISLLTSDWTNYNPSDPGITLLELFSWYKEVQQYHLNALSREHELAYLKLLGASPHDMKPATALLALPPGQLKKLLTPEVLAVLDKYAER